MTHYARPTPLKMTGTTEFDRAVERTPKGAMGPSFGPSTCGECQHWDHAAKRKRDYAGFIARCLKRVAWDRDVKHLRTKPEAVPASTPSCPYFERHDGMKRKRSRAEAPATFNLFGEHDGKKRPGAG
jgi:hypothetical protein